MISISVTDDEAQMRTGDYFPAASVRDAIPGVSWDGMTQVWRIPLLPRPVLALRKFLTGHPVTISHEVAQTLRRVAETPSSPDIVIDRNRIVITFEFHKRYQDFVLALGATARKEGGWSLSLDAAEDLREALDAHDDIDLVCAPEVLAIKPHPIPGFDGSLASLKGVPLSVIKVIKSNVQSVKARKKKVEKTLEERFNDMGINDLFDLALFFPLRYLDRSSPSLIRSLNEGDEATIIGTVKSVAPYDTRRRLSRVVVSDSEGKQVTVTFFNNRWVSRQFRAGQAVILTGKYTIWRNSRGAAVPQIDNPRLDSLLTAGKQRMVPIYPQSAVNTVSTFDIQRSTRELFNRLTEVVDPMPSVRSTMSYDQALRLMHFPSSPDEAEAARRELVRDELVALQLHILASKADADSSPGIKQPVAADGRMKRFIESLPYALTGAQRRSLNEMTEDLASESPMHRLLQGDVSSGKTTIAHALMLNAVDNGHQGALVAPTEILAEQLYAGLLPVAEQEGVTVEFLGTKIQGKRRERILEGLANGSVHVLVGTHALFFEQVQFFDLSTVVIDEQHRFGAAQRSELRNRRHDGVVPDMLVMTATPIPRTGALVVYGDLDVSVLDELPPGRAPIVTEWIKTSAEESLHDDALKPWVAIREQVAAGRQAYVVASLVEKSETLAAASAVAAFETLSQGPLSGLRLAVMHGKMARRDREDVMSRYAAGEIDVLVATTVIEVGVNVPNATVMVVLDAGRFGIAQLHQIRGRVGRASWESSCYFVGEVFSPDGVERLTALVNSTDGFFLSEKDLEIRGEGALFGTRQSGVSDLYVANLRRDFDVLVEAKSLARGIIDSGGLDFNRALQAARVYYQDKEIAS